MKALLVTMSDGSEWAIPLEVIARNRAEGYAEEFDGDVQRSLDEDTMPLFESHPGEASDWATGNMNWSDVAAVAWQLSPPPPIENFEREWLSSAKRVAEIAERRP